MILTDEEIEEGARRLAQSLGGWHTQPDYRREGLREVVRNLASLLDTPRSPEAVFAFLMWMGEPWGEPEGEPDDQATRH